MKKLVAYLKHIISKLSKKKLIIIIVSILILIILSIILMFIFKEKPEYYAEINNSEWFKKYNSEEDFITVIYRDGCFQCDDYLINLKEISERNKIVFYYYNTIKNNETNEENIWNTTKATGTPSLVVIKKGKVSGVLIGSKTSEEIIKFLNDKGVNIK